MIDITNKVNSIVKESSIKQGLCNIFLKHASAGLIINENADPEICNDINNFLIKQIPQGAWKHDRLDGNADSHIKASLTGCNLTIPIEDNKLDLGRWQAVMLCEFDGPRERTIVISIMKI